MYNIETLKQINPLYDSEHKITQSDVNKANRYVEAIQNSRSNTQVQTGDIVELTTRYGNYYKNAHIDRYDMETDEWSVCEQSYIPFIYFNETGLLRCDTSGGAWCNLPDKLALMGKRSKLFKDFGHCGACGNGAFQFEAEVNVWEYKESNPLFGDYSTKDWQRQYISYCADEFGNPKNGSPYRYFGDGIAFINKKDYEAWLKKYKGVEFEGHLDNQKVVFFYRKKDIWISKEKWDSLYLAIEADSYGGNKLCKRKYNDETHTIEVFRFRF